METLDDFAFTDWEMHAERIVPIPEPWIYDLMRG